MHDLEPRLQDLRHPGCRVRRARGTGSRTQGLRSQAWDQGLGSGFRIPKHGVTNLGTGVQGLYRILAKSLGSSFQNPGSGSRVEAGSWRRKKRMWERQVAVGEIQNWIRGESGSKGIVTGRRGGNMISQGRGCATHKLTDKSVKSTVVGIFLYH
jgi:hypothetical protein